MLRRTALAAGLTTCLTAAFTIAPSTSATGAAEPTQTVIDKCFDSVPEPGTTEPVQICYSLFKPAGASAKQRVPLLMHSHGWGGQRTQDPAQLKAFLDAGYGVLSFDQRGFGESGGKAHVEHPDFEGQDVQRLVDVVAGLDWVAHQAPDDPVIGAVGGSYGGGYQLVGAFTELRDRGATRFDALAPEITWWDLRESLAPSGVARTAWVTALYAAGADAHTSEVHQGFAYGAVTGDWPRRQTPVTPDLDWFFAKNGPAWHVARGRVLDIPVLFGQGTTDNLFNLNQGLKSFANALTPTARDRSIFVGYNGGHALPSALPLGTQGGGDPCSERLAGGSFSDLTRRFFAEVLQGRARTLTGFGQHHIATPDGTCVTVDDVTPDRSVEIGQVVSTAAAGAPIAWKVADGPITIAGAASVDADVTSVGLESRVFLALSVGTSPADAQIVQNNMLPLRLPTPITGEHRTIELPGIAVEVPTGQSLFLTVSPVSDLSFGHGSRVPGVVTLDGTVVHLPVA